MPRREDYDDEDYDDDYEPRRRRRHPDPTGGLIPLRNGLALGSYYCGVFGLIPVLGFPLTIAAVGLGIAGWSKYRRNPAVGGAAHAWVGIILGSLQLLGYLILVTIIIIAIVNRK